MCVFKMGSLIAFLLCILAFSVSAKDYTGYQVWRITPTTERQTEWLHHIEQTMGDEFDFWTGVSKIPGRPVDIMVQPNRLGTLRTLLQEKKLDFDVMIDDVNTLVSNQMAAIQERRQAKQTFGTRSIDEFDYEVYHPYDEIVQWVKDLQAQYSPLVTEFLLGQSYEGRDIWGFKIRGTGGQPDEVRPAIWFEGGIHAREWISPATVMGFTQLLIDDYNNGVDLAVSMLDNIDWYIVPSLNPDGYIYTWTEDRMWRKTRSPNAFSGCTGTDPNRNWPFEWGGVGSSPVACSEIYQGSAAMSEPEVRCVVDFLRDVNKNGQDLKVFIDWHSYTQNIIAPWSYRESELARTEDYDDQMAMAQAMTDAILATHGKEYGYGAGAEVLYPAAGSSKDTGYAPFDPNFLYSGLGAKYSYTVELRDTGEYGFVLPENQIRETYEEIYAAVKALGEFVLVNELGL